MAEHSSNNKKGCPYQCLDLLVVLEMEGIEVDHCVECKGTWLDAGELELICERAGVEPGLLRGALEKAKGEKSEARRCPRCGKSMELIKVGDKQKIEIDRCPRGHGLWFDQGELKDLVASFHEGEAGKIADFFAEMYASELKKEGEGE
jgi:Zn-finger nucleic acid-binding protein